MKHALLLVDDEAPLLQAMREYFVHRGFTVDCATEMEEAQALLDCREYAVLICDVALQSFVDAAGLEVISHLRSCSRQTRIILLTGVWHEGLAEHTRALDVDAILIKPQPLSQIAETIDSLLNVTAQVRYANASR